MNAGVFYCLDSCMEHLPYIIIFLLRFTVPLLILKRPFWGYVAALALDIIDLETLESIESLRLIDYGLDYALYQVLDKLADTYMNALALFAAIKFWPEQLALKTLWFLFFYRLFGVAIFLAAQARFPLLIFPNLFEFFYLFMAYKMAYQPAYRIGTIKRLVKIIAALLSIQILREMYLHVYEIPIWGTIKNHIRWLY
jgi:hypothetical protein